MHLTELCLLIILSSLNSCYNMSKGEVYGRYEVQNELGYATLNLRSDMTFEQVVHFNDGKEQNLSGRWEFNADEGTVSLQNAFSVTHGSLNLLVNMETMPVERSFFGAIEINCDPDWDCLYKKQ